MVIDGYSYEKGYDKGVSDGYFEKNKSTDEYLKDLGEMGWCWGDFDRWTLAKMVERGNDMGYKEIHSELNTETYEDGKKKSDKEVHYFIFDGNEYGTYYEFDTKEEVENWIIEMGDKDYTIIKGKELDYKTSVKIIVEE